MNRGLRRAQWRERFQQSSAPLPRQPSAVNLRIDHLVLNGFPKSSARRIANELERELTTLLETRPLPSSWQTDASIDSIRPAPVRLRSFTDTRRTAEQLANALVAPDAGRRRTETRS